VLNYGVAKQDFAHCLSGWLSRAGVSIRLWKLAGRAPKTSLPRIESRRRIAGLQGSIMPLRRDSFLQGLEENRSRIQNPMGVCCRGKPAQAHGVKMYWHRDYREGGLRNCS